MLHHLGLASRVFGLSLAVSATLVVGCRDAESDETGGGPPSSGGGTPSTGGGDVGGGGGGEVAGCEGAETTVQGIATGEVGPGTKVSVPGVVAMSHKFLVSKSSTTDNCLWGVFVSAPGLTETEANSGLLILSYGFKAEIPEGGDQSFCPRLGQDPAGDQIPDNTKPGDVLDVIGTVSRFPDDPQCDAPNPPNQVGMLQLGSVCKATKVGDATTPTPTTLAAADIEKISSTTDEAFHDQWGAVKVRIENVGVEPADGMVVGMYGVIKLLNGVEVGNKIYYRGYSNNVCHERPAFTDTEVVFDRIDGFHYLAFCSWGIQANDKCADFEPQSGDCTAATCEPDFID
jgi:hypothetical protein